MDAFSQHLIFETGAQFENDRRSAAPGKSPNPPRFPRDFVGVNNGARDIPPAAANGTVGGGGCDRCLRPSGTKNLIEMIRDPR